MTNPKHGPEHEGHRGRLKERFLASGAVDLTEGETVELLLTYAMPRKDVRIPAEELLRTFGGLFSVLDASILELTAVEGITRHAAILVRLVREIASICSERSKPPRDVISGTKELASTFSEGYDT